MSNDNMNDLQKRRDNERLQMKSFFYKLSSIAVGYNVYKNEEDPSKIFFGKLVCSKCDSVWETGDTECFYCGTRNYFLYTCLRCKHHFSITGKGEICPHCKKEGTLRQLCLNPDCPTNDLDNYPYLYSEVRKGNNTTGGVFGTKGGFHIRQNSCKHCGCRINSYKFSEVKVVLSLDELKRDQKYKNNVNEVYMERENPLNPVSYYYFLHNNKIGKTSGGTEGIKDLANKITSK